MRRRLLALLAVVLLVTVGGVMAAPSLYQRYERKREIAIREKVVIPQPQAKPQDKVASKRAQQPPTTEGGINWDVPFTSQAPLGVWDPPHKEACEEASALMVLAYFKGKKFESPEDADTQLIRLVDKVALDMDWPEDISAQQVATLLSTEIDSQKMTISVVAASKESMTSALDKGMLIIVPVAGRQLKNPYFQYPGPFYHMLVIRGYTADGFVITNDPGTKRGEQFPYSWDVMLDAIHDWNDGDVENGDKVAVIVGPFVPWKK